MRSLTFLLASVFVKNALDQEFLINKLKVIQATRKELVAYIETHFSNQKSQLVTVAVIKKTKAKILRLWEQANAEQRLLD